MAPSRPGGELRLEVESLGRGTLDGSTASVFPPQEYAVRASDPWTVMANFWRERSLTDHFGLHGGGGVGAGGYSIAVDDRTVFGEGAHTAFAWQVVVGVTRHIAPRITLDLATVSTPLNLFGVSAGNYTSALSACEWLRRLRIYEEPFAVLRR